MKGNSIYSPAYVPARKVTPAPANTDQHSLGMAKPAPAPAPAPTPAPASEASALSSDGATESSNINEEGMHV